MALIPVTQAAHGSGAAEAWLRACARACAQGRVVDRILLIMDMNGISLKVLNSPLKAFLGAVSKDAAAAARLMGWVCFGGSGPGAADPQVGTALGEHIWCALCSSVPDYTHTGCMTSALEKETYR